MSPNNSCPLFQTSDAAAVLSLEQGLQKKTRSCFGRRKGWSVARAGAPLRTLFESASDKALS